MLNNGVFRSSELDWLRTVEANSTRPDVITAKPNVVSPKDDRPILRMGRVHSANENPKDYWYEFLSEKPFVPPIMQECQHKITQSIGDDMEKCSHCWLVRYVEVEK